MAIGLIALLASVSDKSAKLAYGLARGVLLGIILLLCGLSVSILVYLLTWS